MIYKEKVENMDIIKASTSKKELQRLFGMIQYLHKFIPNISDKTCNLRILLKKNAVWNWNNELVREFKEIKKLLMNEAPSLKY